MSDIEFLILFCVVGFLLILFLFVLMFIDQVKQVKNEENQNFSNNRNFIIKPAKSIIGYGIVGLIFSFFIGGLVIYLFLTDENSRHWFIISFFSILPVGLLILGSLCFLYYFKWRLIIKDDSLTQISIIGTEKHFSFEDISNFKLQLIVSRYGSTIYTYLFDKNNKKICKISSHFKNVELLISRLLEKEVPFEKMPITGMTKKQRENFKWPVPYDI